MFSRNAGHAKPSSFLRRRLPCARRFRSEQDGAVAVEFGLVALPFLGILFATIELALLFMTGQALDTSVDEAARQLVTGQAQTSTGAQAINSMATFKQYALCPLMPAIITCSASDNTLQVNVAQISSFSDANFAEPVTNHVLNTSGWGYTPCASGKIMKVEAVYPVPALTTFWSSPYTITVNGTSERVIYASAVFQCEPYAGSS